MGSIVSFILPLKEKVGTERTLPVSQLLSESEAQVEGAKQNPPSLACLSRRNKKAGLKGNPPPTHTHTYQDRTTNVCLLPTGPALGEHGVGVSRTEILF